MHMNKKVKGITMGVPVGLAIGVLISLIITLAGTALASYLLVKEKIGEGTIGFAAILILSIAAIIGALCAVSVVKRLRLQVCLMTGAGYYLSLLALTALFFGGRYQGMGISALIVLGGCALVAFIPTKSGQFFKKKKRAYR